MVVTLSTRLLQKRRAAMIRVLNVAKINSESTLALVTGLTTRVIVVVAAGYMNAGLIYYMTRAWILNLKRRLQELIQ